MIKTGTTQVAGAANNSMDFISFVQQELGQIGAILAGNTGY